MKQLIKNEYEHLTFEEMIEEAKTIGRSHAFLYPTPFFDSSDRFGDLTRYIKSKYGDHSDELSLINSAYLLGFKQEKLSVVHDCFTLLLQYFSENKDHIKSLPFAIADVYKALEENNEEFLFDWMAMLYYPEPEVGDYWDEEGTMPCVEMHNSKDLILV